MKLGTYTTAIAGAVLAAPICRDRLRQRLLGTANIVYYHWVGGTTPHYAEFYQECTLDRFRRDLEFLSAHFDIVPLDRLLDPAESSKAHEVPRVAVTFDDGFNLNRPELLQMLAQFRVSATTLVITACLDNAHLMWRNKLSVIRQQVPSEVYMREYTSLMARVGRAWMRAGSDFMADTFEWEMGRKDELASELWTRCGLPPVTDYLAEHQPYFTRAGLRRWLASGHTVGLHTRSHPRCSRLQGPDLLTEIVQPARELKQEFGLTRLSFSYPFGERFPWQVENELINQAGLSCALGIRGFVPNNTPPSRLERQGLERGGAGWAVLARATVRGQRALHNVGPAEEAGKRPIASDMVTLPHA